MPEPPAVTPPPPEVPPPEAPLLELPPVEVSPLVALPPLLSAPPLLAPPEVLPPEVPPAALPALVPPLAVNPPVEPPWVAAPSPPMPPPDELSQAKVDANRPRSRTECLIVNLPSFRLHGCSECSDFRLLNPSRDCSLSSAVFAQRQLRTRATAFLRRTAAPRAATPGRTRNGKSVDVRLCRASRHGRHGGCALIGYLFTTATTLS